MEIFLFGDQNADCHDFLRHIFSLKENPVLSSFLTRVGTALSEEVFRQPQRPYHEAIPAFESVQELVDRHYASDQPSPAVESAIVCLAQLSHFICRFEELPASYPNPASSDHSSLHLLGACTGLIAASAVASADSLVTLLPLAVEAVRIAFRVGAVVSDVASRLVGRPETSQSWSTVITVTDQEAAEMAVGKWNQAHGAALSNQIWISAYTPNTITISGPSSMRRQLLVESEIFAQAAQLNVRVYGPYHASHLHSIDDVEKIIGHSSHTTFSHSKVQFPVHSNVTGRPFAASSFSDLLKQCLTEVLRKPLRWDRLLEESRSGSLAPLDSMCDVHTIGPSDLTSSLISAVKSSGVVRVTSTDHRSWLTRERNVVSGKTKGTNSDIAIVGMAGRFPDAADHEQFWDLLERGLDVHRTIPTDRYDATTHTDPTLRKKNTSHTPYGNFIKEPGLFDARFFHMSPREAAQTDPMQRLELTTAYEAMEMAGIVPGRTQSTKHDRIGTFYGMTSDDWREINAAQEIDTYFISGGVRAFGSGRINYYFKFGGPSFVIDTACSSSFAAIQLAYTSLQAGNCDTAFAGGANVLTNPDIFSGLSRGHFLSRTGNCKTFDNEADGYCRGEGVATIIMKRIEDVLADKDPILGVIRGTATNHSAEAVSITHPHVGAQQALFEKILRDANTDPRDVTYVEMHGTGTQAGDAVEMESVSRVFAPPKLPRSAAQPLYLGSAKSNIGHGEAASGVCALIKVLLMIQHSAIPPHCGIKGIINQNFPNNLEDRNIRIATKKVTFPRPAGGKRVIFINNFSAAGGNTGLLLEDGPEMIPVLGQDVRSCHIVTVSAKSLASFRKNLGRIQSYVGRISDIDLASLSYTTTARRLHYNYRAAFAISDSKQIELAFTDVQSRHHSPTPSQSPQIAFAFTGQGSQYSEMGKRFFYTSSEFRTEIEYFDGLAQAQGFASFIAIVNGNAENVQTWSPVATQLGLVCIQMALLRLWTYWGLKPSVVIGHSLGEYAALYAAKVLSAADTIFLVGTRAQQLEMKCTPETHAMLAIKAPYAVVQKAISETAVEIACINSESEVVLSGCQSAVESFSETLRADGIKSQKLDVPFAFHSSQVDPVLESFRSAADAIFFHAPEVPVISPLLSEIVRNPGIFNSHYLARHCRETVNFQGGLAVARKSGTIDEKTLWVEVGVHPVCAGMIKSSMGSSVVVAPSIRRGEDPWKTIANALCTLYTSGANINWSAYHRDYEVQLRYLQIPTYSFDEKKFWLQYVNDWTLTKGDPPKLAPVIEAPPQIATTSIHRIIEHKVEQKTATAAAESDLAHPLLRKVVAGHAVNGTGMCPSSLYADMALTLADYTYKLLRPEVKNVTMNVRSMVNPAPLLLKGSSETQHQLVRITSILDIGSREATIQISTLPDNRKKAAIHAQCVVAFEETSEWASEWEKIAFFVRTRIDLLEKKCADGQAHRLLRGMVYKLFESLVDYSSPYKGLTEVVLDTANLEANAQIDLQASLQDGTFYLSPYFIDSIGQLAGFIMNGNDGLDTKNQVFISHGWESMRLPTTLQSGKKYHSWVKMQPLAGAAKTFAGDVYLFDEEQKVIGVFGGLKFQCIPRQLLKTFIPPTNPYTTQPKASQSVQTKFQAPYDPAIASTKIETRKPLVTPKVSSVSGMLARALHIVAREVGVDIEELEDAVQLVDLGVDSLMTLTLSGHFREELELDIESTVLTDCLTVGDLKVLLGSGDTDASSQHWSDESDSGENTALTTPDGEDPVVKPYLVTGNDSSAGEQDVISIIRSTIAEQMDLDLEEISETTDLSNLGMDSLMSLSILGILGERTGRSFEPSLFAENNSIASLRRAMKSDAKPLVSQVKTSSNLPEKLGTARVSPRVTSILLQGNTKTATQNLFLFPDGSGSPTSYSFIPPVSPRGLCIYGLTCPFLKKPNTWTCGVRGVTTMYIDEILRRQPQGPYLIGGWSAGGVFAYEATRQMAAMQKAHPTKNFRVEKLLLLDSPCPVALDPLPSRLHIFFNQIGLLGDGNPDHTPSWLLPHFQATIDSLKAYEPVLMKDDPFDAPETLLIWCTDGVAGNPGDPRPPRQDDDVAVMNWLLDHRTDFSSNGWEKLLGPGKFSCTTVPGNHFTMMREPIASLLRDKIKNELEL